MKKSTVILSFLALGIFCSFVSVVTMPKAVSKKTQAFQYELRDLVLEGSFVDSGNGNGYQKISVVIGITGEPYGFVKTSTFDVGLKTSVSIDANKLILRQKAMEFINENYPDK